MARLSKVKAKIKGSLRGLSAKDYYTLKKFMGGNLVAATQRYLPHNLFVKLDRQHPVTRAQAKEITEAMNRMLFEKIGPQYPFTVPIVQFRFEPVTGYKNKKVIAIQHFTVLSLKSFALPSGTVYATTKRTVTYQDREAIVAFSKHAIDRLIERNPVIVEAAKVDTSFVPAVLTQAVIEKTIEEGPYGPQLRVGKLGYFTMVAEEHRECPLWACTTYLSAGMNGAADTVPTMRQMLDDLQARFNWFSDKDRKK